jgi:HD-GYP domain-containing protein (c-di-GMP phosphodiesterase class II)
VSKLESLLDVATGMAAERNLNQLLQLILREVREAVEADRCSLFIIDRERGELWSKIAQGLEIREIRIPIGVGLAGFVAQTGERVNLEDVYDDPRFDKSWDRKTGYRTRAMLCVPMLNRDGEVTGVIQTINKLSGKRFTEEDQEILMALGSQASATIENALLNDDIDRLFEGFVKASVYAIESRDPTTSGHSERVAALTLGIADALPKSGVAEYKHIAFSPAERKEIRYASLLHDFGKVGVREHVLVKANKLFPLEFELIRQRFELIKRSAERDAWKKKFETVCACGHEGHHEALSNVDRELASFLKEADDMMRFITECNRPTVLSEGGFERLHAIKDRRFAFSDAEVQPFLSDQEVEFLSVRRGSLTLGERHEIESHVVHTYRFLSQIPWTHELKSVPIIAYAHHEKLDGKGYPRALASADIPVQSKMMTISDIYDALTASDRPYKKALPHEKALDILHAEAREKKVDAALLQVFVDAKIHEKLANVQSNEMLSRLNEPLSIELAAKAVPAPTVEKARTKAKARTKQATKSKTKTKTPVGASVKNSRSNKRSKKTGKGRR